MLPAELKSLMMQEAAEGRVALQPERYVTITIAWNFVMEQPGLRLEQVWVREIVVGMAGGSQQPHVDISLMTAGAQRDSIKLVLTFVEE
jgi:hypothetical protein